MELYIVRHGQTDWNKLCKFQGRVDIELNENGEEAAVKLGKRLCKEGIKFDKIFSSPLKRAYKTAVLILNEIYPDKDYEIIKDPNLKEMTFGKLEGMLYSDWMNTTNPRKYFFDEPAKYVAPEGGESFEEVCARTREFVQTQIEPLYKDFKDGRILVTAHGACLSSLMCYLENRGVDRFWGDGLKKNCEETVYVYDGNKWKLKV